MDKNEFWRIQTRITRAKASNDFGAALEEIERLICDGSPDVRMTGLYYRGEIRESQGAFPDAVRDWEVALGLVGGSTFLRHELHRKLAVTRARLGDVDSALASLRSALQICSENGKFSGTSALTDFLRLHGGTIPYADQPLIEVVVVISWQVLEVPDIPDLNDLPIAIAELDRWLSKLVIDASQTGTQDTN